MTEQEKQLLQDARDLHEELLRAFEDFYGDHQVGEEVKKDAIGRFAEIETALEKGEPPRWNLTELKARITRTLDEVAKERQSWRCSPSCVTELFRAQALVSIAAVTAQKALDGHGLTPEMAFDFGATVTLQCLEEVMDMGKKMEGEPTWKRRKAIHEKIRETTKQLMGVADALHAGRAMAIHLPAGEKASYKKQVEDALDMVLSMLKKAPKKDEEDLKN